MWTSAHAAGPLTRTREVSEGGVSFAYGLLHEVAITLPVQSGFGLPTPYFAMHGVLTIFEKKWNRPLGKVV
ncbi:MAG TPA: hypothetical protein VEZ41_03615, partial [Allosphingosinicella sp.]|nr:hypothetical protein [Allosphingosinicella sp.]